MPRFQRSSLVLSSALAVALALAGGCGSDETPTEPDPGPDLTVTSVTVTPESAAFAALGDTVRFTAVASNAGGDEVPAAFVWTSTDAGIATVDTTGLAESVGGGSASIIATADGFADTAAVTVTLTTLVWEAAVDGSWHDPTRWRGGVVPAAGDTARIIIAGDYTVSLAEDTEVARLVLGGNGTQTLAGGASTLTVGTLLLEGGARLQVDGSAEVLGDVDWRSGDVVGGGTLTTGTGGELRVGGGAPILNLEATLQNEGTVAIVSSARLDIPSGGFLVNPAGSLLEFRSDGSILPYAGGEVLSQGTIRKSAGATVSALGTSSGSLTITGPLEVRSGALRINGGDILGDIDVEPDLRLEVLGSTVLGGAVAFVNSGALDIDGSVVIGDQPGQSITIPNLILNNGIVSGTATVAVTDSLVWVRGEFAGEGEIQIPADATARLQGDSFSKRLSGRSLRLNGALTTGSGLNLELDQGASILIESTGRWDQGYAGRIWQTAGSGSAFQIDGEFTKQDIEPTTIEVPVSCAGSLLLDAGRLVLTDAFELTETGLIRGGGRIDQPGQNVRLDLTQATGRILAGTIEPDQDGQTAWLGIAGEVTLTSTTVVHIDLAGMEPLISSERLVFVHATHLAGTLVINRTFEPTVEHTFVVVSRAGGGGVFDPVEGAEGFERIDQDDNSVRLYWPPPPIVPRR